LKAIGSAPKLGLKKNEKRGRRVWKRVIAKTDNMP